MKNKLIHIGMTVSFAAILLFAGCGSSKTPQEQLQLNELDKTTYTKALSTNNAELCSAIEDKALKENCEATIKEQKLKEEAVSSKDPSKCEKLTIENLKKACEIEVKAGIEAEKAVEEIQKKAQAKNDLLNQVIQEGNVSNCDKLEKNFQNICKDSIYFNKAVSEKDANICKKITKQEKRLSCENITVN